MTSISENAHVCIDLPGSGKNWPGKAYEKALYDVLGKQDESKKFGTQFKKA